MKKLSNIFILTFILFFSSCGIFLQKSGVKNYKLKSKIYKEQLNDYQYDFIYLSELLEKGFPNIDSVFSQNKRDSLENVIISKLSGRNITDIDFIIQTRKYISHFHNSHTSIHLKSEFERVFPFVIRIYQNKWYLLNVEAKQDSSLLSKQIINFNGFDISEVENSLVNYISAENKINQQYDLYRKQLYNKPEYLKEVGVLNCLTDSLRITFKDSTFIWLKSLSKENLRLFNISFGKNELTKYQNKTFAYKTYPESNFAYLQFNRCHDKIDILDGITSYVKPWIQPIARWYVKRQFKKEEPSKQIAFYYNSEYPYFKEFVWELVDSCNKNNIENLIIDLRYNPGGNLILGKQLMYFLTDQNQLKDFKDYAFTSEIYKNYFTEEYNSLKLKCGDTVPQNQLVLISESNNPFSQLTDKESKYYILPDRPVFKGNVYVLANYRTGSAAALLTTLLQDNEIATIIGTSVGNNPTGATTMTPFKLPKTKATVSIASTYKERPNKEKGKIQIPDYWIEYSIQDLQTGRDPLLEKVQELIEEK